MTTRTSKVIHVARTGDLHLFPLASMVLNEMLVYWRNIGVWRHIYGKYPDLEVWKEERLGKSI